MGSVLSSSSTKNTLFKKLTTHFLRMKMKKEISNELNLQVMRNVVIGVIPDLQDSSTIKTAHTL